MTVDAWITVAVITAMVLVMAFNLAGPDLVLVGGLAVLLAAGVIAPNEAFLGLANSAVITVAVLYVVAAGVKETGALDWLARALLGTPRFIPGGAQMRLMWPVAALSAFLNNTPVVAMFMPLVQDWARRLPNLSASMLLMPLSYAAILGGTCTIIGTSTNLVVVGMAVARDPSLSFPLFEIGLIGVPAVLIGILYVVLVSPYLLEDRKAITEGNGARAYTIAMRVEPESPVVGKKIGTLRALEGLYLFELERAGVVYPAVSPDVLVEANDVLRFAGVVESIGELRKMRIVPVASDALPADEESARLRRLSLLPAPAVEASWVEAVIAPQSAMVGVSVREYGFRTRYKAAILAVHRQGVRIAETKIGDILLEPGDVLLIEAQPGFVEDRQRDPNFALVAAVADSERPRHDKAALALGILLVMVVVNVTELLPLLTASLLAAAAMLLTGCLSGNQARRSIDWQVIMTVGAALGLATGLERSGAAEVCATALVDVACPTGALGVLGVIYLLTAILAGAVSTKTAAAVMFPIAWHVAGELHVPTIAMSYVIMLSAATAFSTPIGYQTNLMVYGPGGYRYVDFLKLGLPLQVLVGLSSLFFVWLYWL
ncbi:MAG: SLC13 family permease [Sandaracinaceae bacterium]|nr:SLC13 family permease [Sandaracinaceae bacterium]